MTTTVPPIPFHYPKLDTAVTPGWPTCGLFAQDGTVIRKAFRMAVDPGEEGEYERRHRAIWPELEQVLRRHGVRTYSIFLDSATNDLFGYVEVECEHSRDLREVSHIVGAG